VTIASINGFATGGAMEVSLNFHFRLMATGDPALT
jgi:enoyl-CoA hydratase/carnithine racemase